MKPPSAELVATLGASPVLHAFSFLLFFVLPPF